MTENKKQASITLLDYPQVSHAVGPTGQSLSLDDLPPANTKRWVARRKAEIVYAVHYQLLTLEQACKRYSLSIDEFRSWQRLFGSHGLKGLRTTKVMKYRKTVKSDISRPHLNDDQATPISG